MTDDEVSDMAVQLSSILDHVDRLSELDTAGIEPTAHVLDVTTVMRDDNVMPSWSAEQVLANAPRRERDYFVVRAVLE